MFKIHIGELRNIKTWGFIQDPAVALECPLHISIVGKGQSTTTGKSNVARFPSGSFTSGFLVTHIWLSSNLVCLQPHW